MCKIISLKNLKKYLFIYLAAQVLVAAYGVFSCSMWDLVPWPEFEPRAPALQVQSLSHWTIREISLKKLLIKKKLDFSKKEVGCMK